MKIAHQQVRLGGGLAAQGLFKLYSHSHIKRHKKCLGQALVGSLEYNGEIIIGNVHWATESASKPGGVDYHMRRVMSHFTRGLSFEDFVKNRARVRSFRRFFADKREEILKEIRGIAPPAPGPRFYSEMRGPELKDECRKAKIPCSKLTNEQMRERLREKRRQRLQEKVERRSIPTDSVAGSQAASRMTPPSVRSQDIIISPMVISPTFQRSRGREDEYEDHGRASKKHRSQ